MLIIPSVDGENLQKCSTVIRVLRGFVSVINIRISENNSHIEELMKLFDRQQIELELLINGEKYEDKLTEVINAHSDVNIGKVFFSTEDANKVENQITNIRVFGYHPGVIVNNKNASKPSIVNKFEYGFIDAKEVKDYLKVYKDMKNGDFKGNLFIYFGEERIPQEILQDESIDGVYVDVTNNPAIKDTISSYRRIANSIY